MHRITHTRRNFWRGAALSVASLAVVLTATFSTAPGFAQETPPKHDRTFSIAVIPDTQYLYDMDRGNPAPLDAALQWIVDNREQHNIVFTMHLGDIVENARADEFAEADRSFAAMDAAGLPYSALAGNHDLTNSGQYDVERGDEPYLQYFGPERYANSSTFGGASPDGYSTYHRFEGAGRTWLVLALDWRSSLPTLRWAQSVLDEYPTLPVILTTHELVADAGGGAAELSGHGRFVWNELISANDQIFLTLNGHFWPPARTTLWNDHGHEVHLNIANYQDRYYGGSGMLRLYEFDLDGNTIAVSTFSPWLRAKQASGAPLNALEAGEVELVDPVNRFLIPLRFAERFAGLGAPAPAAIGPRAPETMVIAGTVAYWHFGAAGDDGDLPVEADARIEDLSGNGNDLVRVDLLNGQPSDLIWQRDADPRQAGTGSLYGEGSKSHPGFGGAYLQTQEGAPLNALAFEDGYTLEAFFKLPEDCCYQHPWLGLLSRLPSGGTAGKTGDDPDEPVASLALSPGRQVQWALFPTNYDGILTNWSHELPAGVWHHVAVVNDGERTRMYIDGAEVLRNPRAESIGMSTDGSPWLVGATSYGGVVEQGFYGAIGDIRIVDRPLAPEEFMIAE